MYRYYILISILLLYASGYSQNLAEPTFRIRSGPKLVEYLARTLHPGDDTREPEPQSAVLLKDSLANFSAYFSDNLIDSFWLEFKTIGSKPDATVKSIIPKDLLKRSYLSLLKIVYGDSFELSNIAKGLLFDSVSKKQYAEIFCKAKSRKSRGYLDLIFLIEKDSSISLEQMNFIPFDHAQNDFVANLCQNEWTQVKEKQIGALVDTVLHYADEPQKINRPVLEKQLNTIELPAFLLFTSRLYINRDNLYILGIFDADKQGKRLLLCYKLVRKKFKPALVEVLK